MLNRSCNKIKKVTVVLMLFLFCSNDRAESNLIEAVFRENKVKVNKTETLDDITTYDVELPFDPNIGKNSNHLEAQLAEANGCKPFAMVSRLDKLKLVIKTKMKKNCIVIEQIETLR